MVTVTAPFAPDALVAYRDSDGEWSVKKGSDAPIEFAVPSGLYTVAVGCPLTGRIDVYQLTTDDLVMLEHGVPCATATTTLTVQVNGTAAANIDVRWGLSPGTFGSGTGTYMFDVGAGKHDLVVTSGQSRLIAERVVIKRDVEVAGATSVSIDFADPMGIALATQALTYTGIVDSALVTAGGTPIPLSKTNSGLVQAVPESALAPGDLHVLSASRAADLNGNTQVASVHHASRLPPTALAFSPPTTDVPTLTTTYAGMYVASVQAQWATQPDAVIYRMGSDYVGRWVYASPAAFEALGMVELPDLSTVSGWDSKLGPIVPTQDWFITKVTGAEIQQLVRPVPSVEADIRSVGWRVGLN
jgi:hypothetical protein